MSSVLTLWIPCEASKPLYEKITKMYHKQNSDVFFDIKEFPLTQYWKILLESIKNEEGPDLFFMHNEHYDQLKKAGCIAPYQFNEEQFKRLSDVYPMESNKGYYYDFALLTSLLYLQPDIEINPTTAWNACFQQIAKEDKYEYDYEYAYDDTISDLSDRVDAVELKLNNQIEDTKQNIKDREEREAIEKSQYKEKNYQEETKKVDLEAYRCV